MFKHPVVTTMLANVPEFLSQHPMEGTDVASLEEWKASCESSWATLDAACLTSEESSYGKAILSSLIDAHTDLAQRVATKKHATAGTWSEAERRRSMEALLKRPQIEQRTEAWYIDAAGLLSASQFSTILVRSGRTRGLLVMEKAAAQPVDTSNRRTCVMTQELNPFTWGIRFEPVVRQVYEHLSGAKVVDLGRLRHPTDNRLAASPDGLIVDGPVERIGRFVEFKAPVTRVINNTIPEDYVTQMQIQMEVGGVEECDYLEVKFNSLYGAKPSAEQPTNETIAYQGHIFLIVAEDTHSPIRYEYSPLNDLGWEPTVGPTELVLECIPWWTNTWYTTTVGRSRSWFASVQPYIKSFWEDVAKAKEGTFQLPASTRKPKAAVCTIMEDPSEKTVVEDAPPCQLLDVPEST
jgi:hypothetical protein